MTGIQTNNLSDAALIKLAKENHSAAIRALMDRHKRMVFNLAFRLLANYHVAEEAAQDTFVKAFQSLHSFRADSQFGTWLYKICYNTCITYKRRHQLNTLDITHEQTVGAPCVQPHELAEENDTAYYLQQAINSLSDEDAAIVTLFYVDEASTQEIAKTMGLAEGNVRVKLHRARHKLKNELGALLKNEISTFKPQEL